MSDLSQKIRNCCGLDVHRDTIVACVITGYGKGQKKEIKTFRTITSGLEELRSWLHDKEVSDVVLESTGVYWKPTYTMLEADFTVALVNPYHVKNAKGRKTDVKDSEWLCRLYMAGAIRPSFVPPKEIRRLREIVRYRQSLIQDRARSKNRMIKIFEAANIKLSSVFSDVFGLSSWTIIDKILEGVRDLDELTSYVHFRVKASKAEIQQALMGLLEEEDITILKLMRKQLEDLDETIAQSETLIDKHLAPFENEIALMETQPGFSRLSSATIISEIGVDMDAFPSAEQIASWACVCPGNNESAGKQRSSRTRRGNKHIKSALLQAAWAGTRTKDTYYQTKFRALASRKGSKKAIVAISHKMLVATYYMLKRKVPFQELGPTFLDGLQAERKVKYHVKRLEELGYHVSKVEKVKDSDNKAPLEVFVH